MLTAPAGATADQLAEFGHTCLALAVERRKVITDEMALDAYNRIELSESWDASIVPENGRVRGACCHLVGVERFHAEQIVDAMVRLAQTVCVHPEVAAEAVTAGIADGMAMREEVEHG